MADITDIKTILYTEKSLGLQETGVIVVQTSPKMTKNGLREVFQEYFGFVPLKVNSLRMEGKTKRFKEKYNNFDKLSHNTHADADEVAKAFMLEGDYAEGYITFVNSMPEEWFKKNRRLDYED